MDEGASAVDRSVNTTPLGRCARRKVLGPSSVAVTVVAAIVVVALAGPAKAGAGTEVTRARPEPHVCTVVNQVRRLRVTRTDAFPQNGFTFSFPARVTVRSATGARDVAHALCKLRPVPRTAAYACPADFGIVYHLKFTLETGVSTQPVTVDATGCQFAKGAGPGGQIARFTTSAFWATLGRAMGLAHPTNATFRGSRRSG